MRKGIAPLAIAAIAILALVSIEGLLLTNFVFRMEFSVRAVKESVIIEAINSMEFVKRALPHAATYSYHQASYYTASRGGYDDISVESYDCIPYWRIFTGTAYPDYRDDIKSASLSIFYEYLVEIEGEVFRFPSYTVEIDEGARKFKLSSSGELKYWTDTVEITDKPNVEVPIDTGFFRIYGIGKDKFIDTDNIGNSVKTVSDSHACGDSQNTISSEIRSAISSLQSTLNSQYSSESIGFVLTVEDIQFDPSCNSDFAARVLVKIKDTSSTFLAYDYDEKTTKRRNIELKFYVLSGGYMTDPTTSECGTVLKRILPSPLPEECFDGTSYGQCTQIPPKYCDNGDLINKCSLCGCQGGEECQPDESCTPTDGDFEESMFFEYGAETGDLQPPWDIAGPHGGDVSSPPKGAATIDTTHVRTGTKSVKLWQDEPPKLQGDRRVVLREYDSVGTEKDIYWSYWMYFPDIPIWNDATYWHSLGGIRWTISVDGTADFSGIMIQMHQDNYMQISYSNYFDPGDDIVVVTSPKWYTYDNLDQWVHFQAHLTLTSDSTGVAEVWIDDVKYLDLSGLHTDPESFDEWDEGGFYYVRGSPLVGAFLYSDKKSQEAWLWVDDMVAAREKVPETYGVVGK